MQVSEYISSGILELYVMGSLSAEESREVETMAAQHPEVAVELAAVQQTLADYAGTYERNPHPSVRSQVMQAVGGEVPQPKLRIVRTDTKRRYSPAVYRYLIAACLASLIISTFASL